MIKKVVNVSKNIIKIALMISLVEYISKEINTSIENGVVDFSGQGRDKYGK